MTKDRRITRIMRWHTIATARQGLGGKQQPCSQRRPHPAVTSGRSEPEVSFGFVLRDGRDKAERVSHRDGRVG